MGSCAEPLLAGLGLLINPPYCVTENVSLCITLGWREKGTLALVMSQRSDSLQVFPGRGERDGCHFEGTLETDWGSSQFLLVFNRLLHEVISSIAFLGVHRAVGT